MQYRYELINIKKERLEGKKMNPASWQVKNEIQILLGYVKHSNSVAKHSNNNRVTFCCITFIGLLEYVGKKLLISIVSQS